RAAARARAAAPGVGGQADSRRPSQGRRVGPDCCRARRGREGASCTREQGSARPTASTSGRHVILTFPNLEVLCLSLTSGAVPPAVSRTSAVAGLGEQEQIWVEPSVALPRSAQNDLRRLGVQIAKTGAPLTFEVSCWPELLPLRPDPRPLNGLGQTPVLFHLASGDSR